MSNHSADDVACHCVMEGKAYKARRERERGRLEGGPEGKDGRTKSQEYLSPLLHCCLLATAGAPTVLDRPLTCTALPAGGLNQRHGEVDLLATRRRGRYPCLTLGGVS